MSQEEFQTLLNFFKVLGNETRLKIVGLLAGSDCTVRELAELLDLKEPTVSEHLAMLRELDLVRVRPDGNFRVYSFNPQSLYAMNKEVFTRPKLASLVDNVVDEAERKVLQNYFEGDRLTMIPANGKKLLVVLKWLASRFEDGVRYPEKQVNAIISQHHEDFATLRRELVDRRFMTREKGIYWRLPTPDFKDLL